LYIFNDLHIHSDFQLLISMKNITSIAITFLVLTASCKEKIFTGDVDCDDCYYPKPDEAELIIDLTINYKYPNPQVTVYKGDIENKEVVSVERTEFTPYYLSVPVDRKYSIAVEYTSGNKTVIAVNGTNLKALRVSDACGDDCYIIENDHLDLTLKKQFQ
jgi:hypothetical protein